jgi:WD40 repeat protein
LAAGLGSGHRHPNDGQVLLWDVSKAPRLAHQSSISSKPENRSDVMALAWIDSSTLATGDQEGFLQFHHISDSGRLERLVEKSAHARGVRSISAVADERVMSSGNDGVVALWSSSGKLRRQWNLGTEPALLAVAPSGLHVAVGFANGTVYILKL